MKTMIEVDIIPLYVPDYVGTAQSGTNTLDLSELPPEILERLCEDFTNAVFEKAGKERPTTKEEQPFLTHNEARNAIEFFDKEWIGQDPEELWKSALEQATHRDD